MTRTGLVNYLSDKTMIKKGDCEIIVDVVLEGIKKGIIEEGSTKLRGIGTIKTIEREARKSRHPITNETIDVPARRYIRFIPSNIMKKIVRDIG